MTMKESKAGVLTQTVISEEINFNTKVRPGDELSALLFNMALEGIIRECIIKISVMEKSDAIVTIA